MHIFPFQKGPLDARIPLRDNESYLSDCVNLQNGEESHGIRGETLLNKLKYFNVTENTNIDYMHSVLEGVMKRFFKIWFDDVVRAEHKYDFSLKLHKNEIDKRLLSIRVPSFVPVTPRSILDYKLWRAKEFLSFLIYYLLPIFYDLMEPIFLVNITKLVVASEFLLNREIVRSDISEVKSLLTDFVREVEEIYPETTMLSGIHDLLHFADCTISFGPMNCVCCFQFEEINRKIVNLINRKDLIGDEFLLNFSVLQSLETFCSSCSKNIKFNEFISKHNIIKTSNKKNFSKNQCNFGELKDLTDYQFLRARKHPDLKNLNQSEMKFCQRLTYFGILYTSTTNISKRCDFCVFVNPIYGLIDGFIIVNDKIYVILSRVDHLYSPFYDENHPKIQSNIFLCNITDDHFVTTINKLKKVVLIKVNEDLCFISNSTLSHLFL